MAFSLPHARSCLSAILDSTSSFELVFASHPEWPFAPSSSTSDRSSRQLTISCLDSSFNPPTKAHLEMALSPFPRKSDEEGEYDALLLLLSAKNVDKVLKDGDASFESVVFSPLLTSCVQFSEGHSTFRQRLQMIHLMAVHILSLAKNPPNGPKAWSNVAIGLLSEPVFVEKDKVIRDFFKKRDEGKKVKNVRLAWLIGTDTLGRVLNPRCKFSTDEMETEDGWEVDKLKHIPTQGLIVVALSDTLLYFAIQTTDYQQPIADALNPFFNSPNPSMLIHFLRPVTEGPIISAPGVNMPDGGLRDAEETDGDDLSDVSSSLIRQLIQQGRRAPEDWKEIVPKGVAGFVKEAKLYV